MRVCFANMWENELAAAYKRKYFDREINYLQKAVQDSIEKLLGKCRIEIQSPENIKGLSGRPASLRSGQRPLRENAG